MRVEEWTVGNVCSFEGRKVDYRKRVSQFIRRRSEKYIKYVKRNSAASASVSVEDCYLNRVVQFIGGAGLSVTAQATV